MNKQENVNGPGKPDPLRGDTRDARIRYADIIDRPHHVSVKRPQMDRLSRAAQFSPFAALTGYDDLIRESERDVGSRIELDEDRKAQLNDRLARLLAEVGVTIADHLICGEDGLISLSSLEKFSYLFP